MDSLLYILNEVYVRHKGAPRRSANAHRRAKKVFAYNTVQGLEIKNSWYKLHAAAMKRCRGICEQCGDKAVEAHHIRPLSKGGLNALSNLICLCINCHNKRHRHLRGRV